ncbi:MAG: permease-like cell division protein FtsX [Oscillibacter sp.]|nr:permease-like cell division protein FtsX [Oscillibacter sp.]
MGKHDFVYFFQEGVKNMASHRLMSVTAITMTVGCLLIMGTFTLVAVNAAMNLSTLSNSNEIVAYVDEDWTEQQARSLEERLLAIPNVTAARYITREEALEAYTEENPEEELFRDLDPGIFRDRYALTIGNLEQISITARNVERVPGVAKVNYYEELASGIITARNVAAIVSATLIGVLFVVSMFIISNTIRLTTYDRREEIAIMKIVGATNGFIRWPFVYEGFLMGLIAAGIAFLLQWGLYEAVAGAVADSDTQRLFQILPFRRIWLPVLGTFFGTGMLIGIGGSLTAIRRFLEV